MNRQYDVDPRYIDAVLGAMKDLFPRRRDAAGVFYIDRVGDRSNHIDDQGIEYYRCRV